MRHLSVALYWHVCRYATRRACTQADDAVHCYSYVASNSSCTSAVSCSDAPPSSSALLYNSILNQLVSAVCVALRLRQGTCVYTAIEYGGTIGLSDGKEAAKQACQARDDYQNYARLHSYPMLSVLGEQQCFDGVDEPNDLSGYGGTQCNASWLPCHLIFSPVCACVRQD